MHVRILVRFAVRRVIQRTIGVVGLMAFGSQTHVHLRRTEIFVNLLQLSRSSGGLVAHLEGITGIELIERERTERQRHAEIAGISSIAVFGALDGSVRHKIFFFILAQQLLIERQVYRFHKLAVLDAVGCSTCVTQQHDRPALAVLMQS